MSAKCCGSEALYCKYSLSELAREAETEKEKTPSESVTYLCVTKTFCLARAFKINTPRFVEKTFCPVFRFPVPQYEDKYQRHLCIPGGLYTLFFLVLYVNTSP